MYLFQLFIYLIMSEKMAIARMLKAQKKLLEGILANLQQLQSSRLFFILDATVVSIKNLPSSSIRMRNSVAV